MNNPIGKIDMGFWVWLSLLVDLPPKKKNELLKHFSSPEKIWSANKAELMQTGLLSDKMVEYILNKTIRDMVVRCIDSITMNQIDLVTIEDQHYPCLLRNIYDPPAVLYVRGSLISDAHRIGIVGSRKATPYGLKAAEEFAAQLSQYGLTVVSGMARGIDTAAHHGCLRNGGRTLAVLGCGVDIPYPYENRGLMKEITKSGAVISELPPGFQPMPWNFPARNRIISGLSHGVLIVEAGEKSGSLITANLALEQGREVFALPGNVSSLNSKGTNKLIRDGAKIVIEVNDILEELKFFECVNNKNKYEKVRKKSDPCANLEGDERKLAEQLAEEPMHVDALSVSTGLNVQTVCSLLFMLELRGIVEQMPGKIFKLRD